MTNLKKYGSWALITGASSGLGREFATLIAANNVNCVLVGLGEDLLSQLAAELSATHGIACRTFPVDLSSEEDIARLLSATEDIPIGILVNCAGIAYGGEFATREPEQLAQVVKVNCLATITLTRAYLPRMLERGAGAVIIVSSLQAFISCPFESVYCATKAFLLHFGESLWGELQDSPIDCLTVCPAGMKTNLFKAAGYSEADCRRMWQVSVDPAVIASFAIRKLGKTPVAVPPTTRIAAFLARLTPRRRSVSVVRFISRRLVNHTRL